MAKNIVREEGTKEYAKHVRGLVTRIELNNQPILAKRAKKLSLRRHRVRNEQKQ